MSVASIRPLEESPIPHGISASDQDFRSDFLAGRIAPDDFGHPAHLRLGYIYLADAAADGGIEVAIEAFRAALLEFLERHGIPAEKFHETLTVAWLLALRHFMESTPSAQSAADFIDRNPRLLESDIMLSHYSRGLLSSSEARATFVEPDRGEIPRHAPESRPGEGP